MTEDEKRELRASLPEGMEVRFIEAPQEMAEAAQKAAEAMDELLRIQDPSSWLLPGVAWKIRSAWKRYREIETRIKEAMEEEQRPLPGNFTPGKGGSH